MRVLIIDDNKDINEMVRLCLESQDISCKVIVEGKAGLEAIKKENFDVILLDLAMPEFSGFDIFEALKKEDLLKSKNILVFTASSVADTEVENMLASGAKEVLRKPISIDDLIEAVDKFRQERHN